MYGRVQDALGADVDRALVAAGRAADQRLDLGRRPLVAVVPVQGQRLGRVLVPGRRSVTCESRPQLSALGAPPSERTDFGAVRASDVKTGSRMWQPMSPKVPVPKSSRLRQSPG